MTTMGKVLFIGSKNQKKSEKIAKNGKKILKCLVSNKIGWQPWEKYFFALKNLGKFPIKFEKDWKNYLMLGKHGRLMTTVEKKHLCSKIQKDPKEILKNVTDYFQ
jgi:hypothetical protein